MLYTLWGTGCRANELLAIRVNDFETVGGKGKITIHDTKNKHERIVPIPDACTAALNEWKAERRDSDIDDEEFPDLFISSIDGSGLSYAMLRDMVKRYGRIAGLDVHAHAFRHARCSHLLNIENVPPVVVQAMMGHSRLETTMGYCHTGFDDMARYIW
jgi:site-specific recombinase XerD